MNNAPPSASGRLGVVVVNYGAHALLAENLAPLSAALDDAIIVVVDNPTTLTDRASLVDLAARHGWCTVLPTVNLGFGGGVNAGIARAIAEGAEVLLMLNPDASLDRTAVDLLRARSMADKAALVAPIIVAPNGAPWSSGTDLHLDSGSMRASRKSRPGDRVQSWLSAACLMLSVELWSATGGFDERYFLYWEDVDFSWRVLAADGRLVVEAAARATHDEGATHRAGAVSVRAKSSTYYYYNARNRLIYADRHLSAADRRRWRRSWVRAAWNLLMQGGRRQLLHPVAPLGAVISGSIDGLRGRTGSRRSVTRARGIH